MMGPDKTRSMTEKAPSSLDERKFRDPDVTAKGERRACVSMKALKTLWFNTGTLCNITCRNCYIESSPHNDRLVYLSYGEVRQFLDEIASANFPTGEIAFTGGEPFMNPDILRMIEESLERGFEVLVLTNGMKPMKRFAEALIDVKNRFGGAFVIRLSLDHYTAELHESERGEGTWKPALEALHWLFDNDFNLGVAGRTCWDEAEESLRLGYARLFAEHGIPEETIDVLKPSDLLLFPEMDASKDVPEITENCWRILDVSPDQVMCASSRMVVRRKEAERPSVVSCTLLPYDEAFEMGSSLAESFSLVKLNHPHCARFCVLGSASCTTR